MSFVVIVVILLLMLLYSWIAVWIVWHFLFVGCHWRRHCCRHRHRRRRTHDNSQILHVIVAECILCTDRMHLILGCVCARAPTIMTIIIIVFFFLVWVQCWFFSLLLLLVSFLSFLVLGSCIIQLINQPMKILGMTWLFDEDTRGKQRSTTIDSIEICRSRSKKSRPCQHLWIILKCVNIDSNHIHLGIYDNFHQQNEERATHIHTENILERKKSIERVRERVRKGREAMMTIHSSRTEIVCHVSSALTCSSNARILEEESGKQSTQNRGFFVYVIDGR